METSFTGAQSLDKQAWDAAEKLFPDMSPSELEFSYSAKRKLQVKMFGTGKKTYDMFTKDRSTGRDRINPNISKEIKTALEPSKYKKAEETVEELEEKKYEERETIKKEMDESREDIKKKQKEIDDLENEECSQEEIDKKKSELRSLEIVHQKASEKYIQSFTEQMVKRDIQLIEDSEAADFEKDEEEDAIEALKAIKKRKDALDWRIGLEINKSLDPEASPEQRDLAKKKVLELQESSAEATEEEKVFQAKVGEKRAALEKEIKNLQMEREDLVKDNEENTKILKDKNATPQEKEAARDRIKSRDEDISKIKARLKELGIERPLLERVKDFLKNRVC